MILYDLVLPVILWKIHHLDWLDLFSSMLWNFKPPFRSDMIRYFPSQPRLMPEVYPKIPQVNETAGGVVKNVECKVDVRGLHPFTIQKWA